MYVTLDATTTVDRSVQSDSERSEMKMQCYLCNNQPISSSSTGNNRKNSHQLAGHIDAGPVQKSAGECFKCMWQSVDRRKAELGRQLSEYVKIKQHEHLNLFDIKKREINCRIKELESILNAKLSGLDNLKFRRSQLVDKLSRFHSHLNIKDQIQVKQESSDLKRLDITRSLQQSQIYRFRQLVQLFFNFQPSSGHRKITLMHSFPLKRSLLDQTSSSKPINEDIVVELLVRFIRIAFQYLPCIAPAVLHSPLFLGCLNGKSAALRRLQSSFIISVIDYCLYTLLVHLDRDSALACKCNDSLDIIRRLVSWSVAPSTIDFVELSHVYIESVLEFPSVFKMLLAGDLIDYIDIYDELDSESSDILAVLNEGSDPVLSLDVNQYYAARLNHDEIKENVPSGNEETKFHSISSGCDDEWEYI